MWRNTGHRRIVLGFLLLCVAGGCQSVEVADLVLLNGKVVTVDDAHPEGEAIAIVGDRILAVGSDEAIRAHVASGTEVIDLEGRLAIPGLIDSHAHFTSLGRSMTRLQLMHVRNWDEVVAMVAQAVEEAEPGEWIQGRGWHREKWDTVPQPNVDGLPYHDSLSAVSPDNPVVLGHASGHACFANAKAMELAGISAETPNPDGGEIVRDASGQAIGVFRETAEGLISRGMSSYDEGRTAEQLKAERIRIIELAEQECLSKGITSFHDAGVSFGTVDLFRELAESGELDVRLYAMLSEGNARLEERIADYRLIGVGNHHLTVRSVKRLIDGALGSHGAWLLEPYESLPTSVGLNTEPVEKMRETARIAIENGFQLCTHAIGDRGNRETLDIYAQAFATHPDKEDLRWRVEHAQHIHPDDVPRFGRLGVIAAMQGIHCTSDAPWVIKRLGEERAQEGAYVWRDLRNAGAVISNGTDAPVEDVDPIASFHASVSRRTKSGDVFYGDQAMTRAEALRSYTLDGAYAAFDEDLKGSLSPGKLADVTVLSRDIMTIPAEEILGTQVVYTIVGGEVKYKKAGE